MQTRSAFLVVTSLLVITACAASDEALTDQAPFTDDITASVLDEEPSTDVASTEPADDVTGESASSVDEDSESLLGTVTTRSGPVREDIEESIAAIPTVVENHRACMDLTAGSDMPPFELKPECDFNTNFEGIFNGLIYVRLGLDDGEAQASGECLAAVEDDNEQDGDSGFEAALEAHRDTYIVGYVGVTETFAELERVAPLRVDTLQGVLDACS